LRDQKFFDGARKLRFDGLTVGNDERLSHCCMTPPFSSRSSLSPNTMFSPADRMVK
jgi:hypothetical protein